MIIIALADIHGGLKYLPGICEELKHAHLVLVAGDITNFGKYKEAAQIVSELRKHNPRILAIPGNCDKAGVSEYLAYEGINLDCKSVKVEGITLLGLGGSLPCPGRTPNEAPDEQFAICLKELGHEVFPDGSFVLVTHQPAFGTVVDKAGEHHTGSRSIRSFIERYQPLLAVSGHIHEAVGVDHIGKTTLVNPGPLRHGKYAYIEIQDGKVVKAKLRCVAKR